MKNKACPVNPLPKTRWATAFGLSLLSLLFSNCAGTYAVNPDISEVCQGIDFDLNPEMRADCGVKERDFKANSNRVEYRQLANPADGKLENRNGGLQMCLPQFLPVTLPDSLVGKIRFGEQERREVLPSRYDYREFFLPSTGQRVRMMKIDLPLSDGKTSSLCYTIPEFQTTQAGESKKFSRAQAIDCRYFEKWKREKTKPPAGSSAPVRPRK